MAYCLLQVKSFKMLKKAVPCLNKIQNNEMSVHDNVFKVTLKRSSYSVKKLGLSVSYNKMEITNWK